MATSTGCEEAKGFERLQGDQNQVKNEWILGGPSANMWGRMLAEMDNLAGGLGNLLVQDPLDRTEKH